MQIIHGDCLEILRSLPEHSVDAICSDPPAGINFMNMPFDSDRGGRDTWITWLAEIMSEARRVVKPGGHAFIWALPRTSHWTALALENAGWEIREKHYHVFGSGFPKSHNISKAIDRHFQAEREVVGYEDGRGTYDNSQRTPREKFTGNVWNNGEKGGTTLAPITTPATPEAQQWDGWGTATKPAVEEWILARALLAEKSIAENVLKYGVGGLNIDGTRVGNEITSTYSAQTKFDTTYANGKGYKPPIVGNMPHSVPGRFPSNFLLSHSLFCTEEQCIEDCPVALLDRQSGISKSVDRVRKNKAGTQGYGGSVQAWEGGGHNDQGGASRYFQTFYYCPKPSKREKSAGCEELPEVMNRSSSTHSNGQGTTRMGNQQERTKGITHVEMKTAKNHHPTVKPVQLMQYLCRLITPPGGTVLDPFTGSGTTGVACVHEGFNFIGIERESEYVDIALARIEHALKLHAGK